MHQDGIESTKSTTRGTLNSASERRHRSINSPRLQGDRRTMIARTASSRPRLHHAPELCSGMTGKSLARPSFAANRWAFGDRTTS